MDKSAEKKISPRCERYTDDKEAYEKMLNIICH